MSAGQRLERDGGELESLSAPEPLSRTEDDEDRCGADWSTGLSERLGADQGLLTAGAEVGGE